MQKLLIVGLGNPGPQYRNNRHNIGFMVLDKLAQDLDVKFCESKNLKSYIATTLDLILCKPLTYMNASGEAIRALRDYYDLQEMLVVHDELEIALGALRFKRGGGHGGHNGLRSIDAHCGNDYVRARCGIGRPKEKSQVAHYVLSDFNQAPLSLIQSCVQAVSFFAKNRDLQKLQSTFSLQGEREESKQQIKEQ